MTSWTMDELTRIGTAEELRIASLRRDGTLNTSRIVWVVRHGDDLYVRSVQGRTAAWFRATQVRHEGRIWAGGIEKDVRFEEAGDLNDELDVAYRTKYRHSPSSVAHITSPVARSATLRLVPR